MFVHKNGIKYWTIFNIKCIHKILIGSFQIFILIYFYRGTYPISKDKQQNCLFFHEGSNLLPFVIINKYNVKSIVMIVFILF